MLSPELKAYYAANGMLPMAITVCDGTDEVMQFATVELAHAYIVQGSAQIEAELATAYPNDPLPQARSEPCTLANVCDYFVCLGFTVRVAREL